MTPKRRHGLSRFQRLLDGWILAAVDSGASTFDEILLTLPGVFPLDLVHALRRLQRNRRVLVAIPEERDVPARPIRGSQGHATILPPPHLLDFDWRFSADAADFMLQSALRVSDTGDRILFVGTPTVALDASSRVSQRVLALVEWNERAAAAVASSTSIAVTHLDALRDAGQDFSSDVVIIDPPWYRDYLRCFLWTAAQWCRPGGHVLVSMPPIGTRPEMEDEHRALNEFAHLLGLKRVNVTEGALPYVTPPFEINALLASGFDIVHPMWRRGDLWILRRTSNDGAAKPDVPSRELWTDLALGLSRVKIRCDDDLEGEIDPRLVGLFDRDICPSVSRYHPARQAAVVWTSNNRAFSCKSPTALAAIAQAIASQEDPGLAVARDLERSLTDLEIRRVLQATENLHEIAVLERDELLSFEHAYEGTRLARSAS